MYYKKTIFLILLFLFVFFVPLAYVEAQATGACDKLRRVDTDFDPPLVTFYCEKRTRANCTAAGGDYLGDNEKCPLGACENLSYPDGSRTILYCAQKTRNSCNSQGGSFQGNGTSCKLFCDESGNGEPVNELDDNGNIVDNNFYRGANHLSIRFQYGLVPCGKKSLDDLPICRCELGHVFILGKNIFDFIVWYIATPLAALIIVLGGLMILVSGGPGAKDPVSGVITPNLYSRGKAMLTGAAVALLLIFGAWLIVSVLLSAFGYTESLRNIWNRLPI